MKKVLFPILALVLAVSLALPMAAVVSAAPDMMYVVSGDTGATVITTVYNKALGVQTTVTPTTPLTPVRAWEPDPYSTTYLVEPGEATDSTWDNGVNWFEDNFSSADWIWETHIAEGPASYAPADPLYDADAARYGRVVLFETTFNIPGNPSSATLRIAADNGYEAWVNIGTHYRSLTAAAGWETSNLHQASLTTSGWQSYGTFVISGSELVNGSNTLYVLAGNEYFGTDDGDSPVPPTQGTWGNPDYHQYNPGAAIFQLDVEYEEFVADPGINIEKSVRGGMTRAHEGDSIIYIYTVTNTGNVPLSSVAVTDPDVDRGPVYVSGDDSDGILQTTETWIYRAAYVVPYFFAGPVTNTGTATGEYKSEPVSDTSDAIVHVVHNPDIEVDKQGPPSVGYFLSTNAEYTYIVTNPGDCSLNVSLTDDLTGTPVYVSGDTNLNLHLDPDETWTYTDSQLLECTDPDQQTFINTATAVGTDALGATVTAEDDWSVTIFQWLPGRTIGYWSNWDNHFASECIEEMVERVVAESTVFNEFITDFDETNTDASLVYDIIKGQDQKGKMTVDKAKVLLSKQLMAAWLNVQSGIGATDDDDPPVTCGSMDAALWQYATVYLSNVSGAETLFGEPTMSVIEVLQTVEANWNSWTANELLLAKDVLDKMNNAQNNGYFMFMP